MVQIFRTSGGADQAPAKHKRLSHDVLDDDTVGVMVKKLERLLGDRVYVWCRVELSAWEAFGIIHANAAADGDVKRAFAEVTGAKWPADKIRHKTGRPNEIGLLRHLRNKPTVGMWRSVMFGYMRPGGYYVDHGIDPWKSLAVDRGFLAASRAFSQADNFSALLVESFQTDAMYVVAMADLERARTRLSPDRAPSDDEEWQQGVIDKYFPALPDNSIYPLSDSYTRALRALTRFGGAAAHAPPALRSMCIVGGKPLGSPDTFAPDVVNAFSNTVTTESMPIVQIYNKTLSRPTARVHARAKDDPEVMALLKTAVATSRSEWIQFVFHEPKLIAKPFVLTINAGGAFTLTFRFSSSEGVRPEAVARVFPAVNAVLQRVSPFYPEIAAAVWHPPCAIFTARASVTGPRPYVMRATQSVDVTVPHRCTFEAVAAAVTGAGHHAGLAPVAKAINTRERRVFMQYARSNAVSIVSVVRSYLFFNRERMSNAMYEDIQREFNIDHATIQQIEEMPKSQSNLAPVAILSRRSDTRYVLEIQMSNDVRYIERLHTAVQNAVGACSDKAGRRGRAPTVADRRGKNIKTEKPTVSGSTGSASVSYDGNSRLSELYELLYNSYDEAAEKEAEKEGEKPEKARDDGEKGEKQDRNKVDIGSDTLHMLQNADRKLFDYKQEGFEPYSRKCGKNKAENRQPVVITSDSALSRAAQGSTGEAVERGLRYGSAADKDNTYICPEKWCPASGVARRIEESCPDPLEPAWVFGKGRHPGFLQGEMHPEGLCMPCCFNKRPVPGSETHGRISACTAAYEAKAGRQSRSAAADAPDAQQNQDSPKLKKHVNRAARVLKRGDVGSVPEELRLGKVNDPVAYVRMGMGASTNFSDVCAYYRNGTVAALHHDLAERMRIHHFVQCGVRAYVDVAGTARPASTPEYRRMMSLDNSKGSADAQRREGVIQYAYEAARRSFKADTSNAGISYEVLYKLVNSGALPDMPPVLVVALDAAGNAFVDHVHAGRLEAAEHVHVCLAWRGSYEPLGTFANKRFEPRWSAEHPWVRRLAAALRRAVAPAKHGEEAYRVVTHAMMAVGAVVKKHGGAGKTYVPFDAPVSIDPDARHRYVADGALSGVKAASSKASSKANVIAGIIADDVKDGMLFRDAALDDTRVETLRELKVKLQALYDVQMAVARSGAEDEEGIRREAKKAVAGPGPAREAVREFVVANMLRPLPSDALPFIRLAEHETFM